MAASIAITPWNIIVSDASSLPVYKEQLRILAGVMLWNIAEYADSAVFGFIRPSPEASLAERD